VTRKSIAIVVGLVAVFWTAIGWLVGLHGWQLVGFTGALLVASLLGVATGIALGLWG
jgi:hypothetical protein